MVESISNTFGKKRLRVARGVVKTLPNQPPHIMIINTSKVAATLSKNMKLTYLKEAPSSIVLIREVSGVDYVSTIPISNGKQDKSYNSFSISL